MGGRGYFNNVFPLSGNFPTDPSGINMTLLPSRPTGLVLPHDNDRMLFDLGNILDDLFSQDNNTLASDTHILGVTPSGSGGVAERPGESGFWRYARDRGLDEARQRSRKLWLDLGAGNRT
ncbi:MAG: hypothetical protein DLM68_11100 [Hyphomicrobiales bacterium]|nr:MAG: hypothetical protein DLM68_11100 [Hyphomicrobiales bacterium]